VAQPGWELLLNPGALLRVRLIQVLAKCEEFMEPIAQDSRTLNPIALKERDSGTVLVYRVIQTATFESHTVSFPHPNSIALLLSITSRELNNAENCFSSIVESLETGASTQIPVNEIYSYLEHVQIAIFSIFTAIESMCNAALPADYERREKSTKGIVEIWDKAAIERWKTTQEKLAIIIPAALACDSPTNQPFWPRFKCLQNLRHDIVHQKHSKGNLSETKTENSNKSGSLNARLCQPETLEYIKSGIEVIRYFCLANPDNENFPILFFVSQKELKPKIVDSFTDVFLPPGHENNL